MWRLNDNEKFYAAAPYPPKNLVWTSSPDAEEIGLKWSLNLTGIHDKLILKFCHARNRSECISEVDLEKHQTSYKGQTLSADIVYSIYLITQYRGVNSSQSNFVLLNRGNYVVCMYFNAIVSYYATTLIVVNTLLLSRKLFAVIML